MLRLYVIPIGRNDSFSSKAERVFDPLTLRIVLQIGYLS